MNSGGGMMAVVHGTLRRRLHWTIAFTTFAALMTGAATWLDSVRSNSELLWALFSLHKPLGIVALVLAFIRLWSWVRLPLKRLVDIDRFSVVASGFIQVTMLTVGFVLPLTGLLTDAFLSGGAPIFGIPEHIWKPAADPVLAARFGSVHLALALLLCTVLALHIAGGLKHHIVDKDPTLRSMLRPVQDATAPRRMRGYILPALVLVAGVAFSQTYLNVQQSFADTEEQSGNWIIDAQKSRITVSFQAEGFDIDARFARFNANVSFNPEKPENADVAITIDTTSFISGFEVVDERAKGEDWLETDTNPVATWHATGAKLRGDGRFEMVGDLTIGSVIAPVAMVFQLLERDGETVVSGKGTFRRDALGLGAPGDQASEEITVTFNFVARRKE